MRKQRVNGMLINSILRARDAGARFYQHYPDLIMWWGDECISIHAEELTSERTRYAPNHDNSEHDWTETTIEYRTAELEESGLSEKDAHSQALAELTITPDQALAEVGRLLDLRIYHILKEQEEKGTWEF
jgi:hypothetical protein